MGTGASTEGGDSEGARKLRDQFSLHSGNSRAELAFNHVDVDNSGGIEKAEFAAAARTVGLVVTDDELDGVFKQYDADGNGHIDQSEFLKFFAEKQSAFFDEDKTAVDKMGPEDLKSIIPYLGPREAARGFRKALMVLEKNPAAAAASMTPTNPMRPLHILLTLDAPPAADDVGHGGKKANRAKAKEAAQQAACQAAGPLIAALLRADPAGASVRVKPHPLLCPDGHLPLHLALERRWPLAVVQMLLQAYPDGATTVDAAKSDKKGKRVSPSLKSGRWARKIAEDAHCDEEVLKLLPVPKKKGNGFEWKDPPAQGHHEKKKGKGKK